jgi:hypothetical protein
MMLLSIGILGIHHQQKVCYVKIGWFVGKFE